VTAGLPSVTGGRAAWPGKPPKHAKPGPCRPPAHRTARAWVPLTDRRHPPRARAPRRPHQGKPGGGDRHIIGSTQLAQALLNDDLVDGLRLMIDPLVLGGGKRFLPDDGVRRPMELIDSTVTSTGAILATYALTAA
jgi:RibD domain-containing protein